MARPTKAQAGAIASRRTTAIQLRIAGVEPLAIGRKLAADPVINSDGAAYPMGYGHEKFLRGEDPPSDKRLIIRVCQDIQIALEQRSEQQKTAVANMRELEAARLDQMQTIAFKHALGGPQASPDFMAMDRVLRIMERRAKLFGLDAPTEISGAGGDPIIVEIASDLLPQPPAEDAGTP